jgi:S1-C subfamily serine protease
MVYLCKHNNTVTTVLGSQGSQHIPGPHVSPGRTASRIAFGVVFLLSGFAVGAASVGWFKAKSLSALDRRVASLEGDVTHVAADLAKNSGDLMHVRKESETRISQFSQDVQKLQNGSPLASLSAVAEKNRDAIGLIVCADANGTVVSTGSGTVFRSDGRVLTNYHVIAANDATHQTGDELPCAFVYQPWKEQPQLFALRLAGLYPDTDLAVLQLAGEDGASIPSSSLRDLETIGVRSCTNDSLRIAEPLLIVGYPNYSLDSVDPTLLNLKVTTGVISSLLPSGDVVTDAKIEHGNSGGAAFSASGCFIGVPTAVLAGQVETLGVIRRFTGA